MRHSSILTCGIVVCMVFISCKNNNLYYIHHTKFDRFDYRIPCNPELVDKINTNWLKHGKYHCHYYNQFVQDFPINYRDCVIGLDKSLIKQLFGNPNSDTDSKFEYIIADRCAKHMKSFSKLVFIYNNQGKIIDVTFGSINIVG